LNKLYLVVKKKIL